MFQYKHVSSSLTCRVCPKDINYRVCLRFMKNIAALLIFHVMLDLWLLCCYIIYHEEDPSRQGKNKSRRRLRLWGRERRRDEDKVVGMLFHSFVGQEKRALTSRWFSEMRGWMSWEHNSCVCHKILFLKEKGRTTTPKWWSSRIL